MKSGDRGKDVEAAVSYYLRENPEVSIALGQGIVNLSSLAKLITSYRPDLNPISVRAALNRKRERQENRVIRDKADSLIRKSKISLQDKITVVKSDTPLPLKHISATFLENSVVYIIDEMDQKVPVSRDGVSVERNVSMLHILSPREIETTPGFIMRITQKLYARNINVMQLISCSNETILILSKDECVKAYEVLSSV